MTGGSASPLDSARGALSEVEWAFESASAEPAPHAKLQAGFRAGEPPSARTRLEGQCGKALIEIRDRLLEHCAVCGDAGFLQIGERTRTASINVARSVFRAACSAVTAGPFARGLSAASCCASTDLLSHPRATG